jgi:hypothetical protein
MGVYETHPKLMWSRSYSLRWSTHDLKFSRWLHAITLTPHQAGRCHVFQFRLLFDSEGGGDMYLRNAGLEGSILHSHRHENLKPKTIGAALVSLMLVGVPHMNLRWQHLPWQFGGTEALRARAAHNRHVCSHVGRLVDSNSKLLLPLTLQRSNEPTGSETQQATDQLTKYRV